MVPQKSLGPYCYWYWYCNLSSANIGIDIVIGKHTLSVLILVLLLQDTFNKYCLPYWYCKTISQVLRKELHQKFHYPLKTMIIYKCKMPLKAIQKFWKWPEIALKCPFSAKSIFLMDINIVLMQLNCYCIEIDIAKHTRPVLLLKLILQNTLYWHLCWYCYCKTCIWLYCIEIDIAKHLFLIL